MFQSGLNKHLFSKLSPLFVFSISVVKLINQSFDLCDRPIFKMNIYHILKVSYIIRHVIIKHALVKELLILQVQYDDINLDKNAFLSTNHLPSLEDLYIFNIFFFDIIPEIMRSSS